MIVIGVDVGGGSIKGGAINDKGEILDEFTVPINRYVDPEITFGQLADEIENFISKLDTKYPIHLVKGEYDPKVFFEISRGLENEPERGKRCYKCYELRLDDTARMADKMNIKYFASTLTLSPYKNSDWVNEIGKLLDTKYNSHYLYSDFKKKNGYKRSIELSKKYNLYRQNYCGCKYSKRED